MDVQLDSAGLDILRGRLGLPGVPLVPERVVRVYVSSTGEDSQTERNAFVENVYPKLREYCRNEYAMEFQAVDLEWGLAPDARHVTPESARFRQEEISRCHTTSAGPSFIAFMGQKYGDCPLPATILATEFETIRMTLHHLRSRETRGAAILDDWYIRDDNQIPPVYVLRSPTDIIPELNDEDENKRANAGQQKSETVKKIRHLLEKGADICYNQGKLDSDTKLKYQMSEQELEISLGIGGSDNPHDKCVLIMRNIVDLKNYIGETRTPVFTEIVYNDKTEKLEFDADSEIKLQRLKTRAKNLVTPKNTLSHSVLWKYDDVINAQHHSDYLTNLCSQLCQRLIHLTDTFVAEKIFDFPAICEEPLLHLERCRQLGSIFHGWRDRTDYIREYLVGSSTHPLVITGESCTGKTTLLSRMAQDVPDLFGEGGVLVVRYPGLSQMSASVCQVLTSICSQLHVLTDRTQVACIPADIGDLSKYFHELLRDIPKYISVVIMIDGLDELIQDPSLFHLQWLSPNLPDNVKLIVTCQAGHNTILDMLQQDILKENKCYMNLGKMTESEFKQLFKDFVSDSSKQLTAQQLEYYHQFYAQCSIPLHVRLLAEEAKTLRSSDIVETRPDSFTEDTVQRFFDNLEKTHGKLFVSRSMAFLAASDSGLSDCEMEDLLSLDEVVLNETHSDYQPAVRRIPPVKWLHLKKSISPFLTHLNTDGASDNTWSHKLLMQTSKTRYLADVETTKQIHSILSDYYLGTWADVEKPAFLGSDKRNDSSTEGSNRHVPSQPLTFISASQNVRFNKRKYDKVPRHLELSGREDELSALVLFNYEWLYNKIKALSLGHIMDDFALSTDREASLVERALRLAEPTLRKDINNLAPEITGHLLPYYGTHPHIRSLIKQCDTIGLEHCALIPNFPYFNIPGTSLQFSMDCPLQNEFLSLFEDGASVLAKDRDSSYVHRFDLITGELKNVIFTSIGDFLVSKDGKCFIIVDHVTEKAIKFHNAENGKYLGQIIILNHIQLQPNQTYKKGPMCVSDTTLCAIVTTDISYLCVADISSFKLIQILVLDGKSTVCEITPDGRYVFCNSNEVLLSYDLATLELLYTVPVDYKPNKIVFTHDGCRAFLSNCVEQRLFTLHLNQGIVDMRYKTVLDDYLAHDCIDDLKVSPSNELVMIQAKSVILVQDRVTERICATFERPSDIPLEFRLPKSHYKQLVFTRAEFSQDSRHVIGAIFRNVYVWDIHAHSLIATLQAPIGIITSLLVTRERNQIVTQQQGTSAIQVWNIDNAVNKVDIIDKVVGSLEEILVTHDDSVAYVRSARSDAIGVIDVKTGGMVDLLTHDSDVQDMAITPSGNYLLLSVTPKMSNTANRIWDMGERRVIKEFGNAPGHCVSVNQKNIMIFVGQKETSLTSPFYTTVLFFTDGAVIEEEYLQTFKYVLQKPIVTSNDRFIVVLTSNEYFERSGKYGPPSLSVFDLHKDVRLTSYNMETLELCENSTEIIGIKPCPCMDNLVAVTYVTANQRSNENGIKTKNERSGGQCGFLLFEVGSGWITRKIEDFCSPSKFVHDLVFSRDMSFCVDRNSRMYELMEGELVQTIFDNPVRPRIIAAEGTVVIYYRATKVYVIRIADSKMIAKCEVHANISCITLCNDERTFILGCADGTVASFVLIDPTRDRPEPILEKLLSRQVSESTKPKEHDVHEPEELELPQQGVQSSKLVRTDSRSSRTWDKIDQQSSRSYSRPPSVVSNGPRDKDLLKQIPHVKRPRPRSDTVLYVKSAVCTVM